MFRGCSRTLKTPNSPPLPSRHVTHLEIMAGRDREVLSEPGDLRWGHTDKVHVEARSVRLVCPTRLHLADENGDTARLLQREHILDWWRCNN